MSGAAQTWHQRFSGREKARLVGEILAVYVRVRWLMRTRAVVDALAALRTGHRRGTSPERGPGAPTGARLGSAVVRTLAVLPTDSRCLMRSLVLSGLLARRGIEGTLVIGARTAPGFGAHAWVECGGVPVLPPGDDSLGRLTEL